MTYQRHAESACLATAKLPDSELKDKAELEREGRGSFVLRSTVRDAEGEVVADAEITWHVKSRELNKSGREKMTTAEATTRHWND